MHTLLPAWLALSAALLFPSATAFYPYHYGDSPPPPPPPPPSVRSRRIASHDNTNAPPITLPLRRLLASRQNTYNIVRSNQPKQAKSVAIDQDGGDLSYMVAVTFGSSNKEYHLLLDSAASNTWVMGQSCASDACKTHNTLGTGDSSSLKTDTKPFNITYGTGSISGNLATDTLHLGPLSPSLTFGLATTVSQEFRSYPMDGIMGIGRGIKTGDSIGAPQVMDALASSNLIGAKLYGIHLSRNKDGTLDGELNLGDVNKDRFSGDINWLQAIDNDRGFWEIAIDDAVVNGNTVGLSGRTAIIDTGTSYVLMPQSDAMALHAKIAGSKQDGEIFSVPCDTTSTVQFSFNSNVYNISTADWKGGKLDSGLCASNIIGRQTFSDTQWLVGDVFLKNVYSVFDFDNKRVGFGIKSSTTSANANMASSTSNTPSSTNAASQTQPGTGSGAKPNSSAAAESQPQSHKGSNDAAGRLVSLPLIGGVMVVFLFMLSSP